MAEAQISQADIDNLAGKLDELAEVLTENERALLLAVFGLAGTALSQAGKQAETEGAVVRGGIGAFRSTKVARPAATELRPLSEGFKNAFKATGAGRFTFGGGAVASVSVGGTTVTWSD